jgi:hypothetical protein
MATSDVTTTTSTGLVRGTMSGTLDMSQFADIFGFNEESLIEIKGKRADKLVSETDVHGRKDLENSIMFTGTVVDPGQEPGSGKFGDDKRKISVVIDEVVGSSTSMYRRIDVKWGGFDEDSRANACASTSNVTAMLTLHWLDDYVREYLKEHGITDELDMSRQPKSKKSTALRPRYAMPELMSQDLPTEFMARLSDHMRPLFEKYKLGHVPNFKLMTRAEITAYEDKNKDKNSKDKKKKKPIGSGQPSFDSVTDCLQRMDSLANDPDAMGMLLGILEAVETNKAPESFRPGMLVKFKTAPTQFEVRKPQVSVRGFQSCILINPATYGGGKTVSTLHYYMVGEPAVSIGPDKTPGMRVYEAQQLGFYTIVDDSFAQKISHHVRSNPSTFAAVAGPAAAAASPSPSPSSSETALTTTTTTNADGTVAVVSKAAAAGGEKLAVDLPIGSMGELRDQLGECVGTRVVYLVQPPQASGGTAEEAEQARKRYEDLFGFAKRDEPDKKLMQLNTHGIGYSWKRPVLSVDPDGAYVTVDVSGLCVFKVQARLYAEKLAGLGLSKYSATTWMQLAPIVMPYAEGILRGNVRMDEVISQSAALRATNSLSLAEQMRRVEGLAQYEQEQCPGVFRIPLRGGSAEAKACIRLASRKVLELEPNVFLPLENCDLVWEPKEFLRKVAIPLDRASAEFILNQQRGAGGVLTERPEGTPGADVRHLSYPFNADEKPSTRLAALDESDWSLYYVGELRCSGLDDPQQVIQLSTGRFAADAAHYRLMFSPEYAAACSNPRAAEKFWRDHGIDPDAPLAQARINVKGFTGLVMAMRAPIPLEKKKKELEETRRRLAAADSAPPPFSAARARVRYQSSLQQQQQHQNQPAIQYIATAPVVDDAQNEGGRAKRKAPGPAVVSDIDDDDNDSNSSDGEQGNGNHNNKKPKVSDEDLAAAADIAMGVEDDDY